MDGVRRALPQEVVDGFRTLPARGAGGRERASNACEVRREGYMTRAELHIQPGVAPRETGDRARIVLGGERARSVGSTLAPARGAPGCSRCCREVRREGLSEPGGADREGSPQGLREGD